LVSLEQFEGIRTEHVGGLSEHFFTRRDFGLEVLEASDWDSLLVFEFPSNFAVEVLASVDLAVDKLSSIQFITQ
jgi:hypothetical protein